jgi:hypothetical protein
MRMLCLPPAFTWISFPGLFFEPEDGGDVPAVSVEFLRTRWGYIPKDNHRYENLKSDLNLQLTEWFSYVPVSKLQNTVTCSPISRQRPEYAHEPIENALQEVFSMLSASCPVLGNRATNKHSDT